MSSVPEISDIVALDGTSSDNFGSSASLSGNLLVVGAPYKNSYRGETYIFDCSIPTNCSQASVITELASNINNFFGASVSASGNLVVIGSPGANSNLGQVYLYNCANFANCILQSRLVAINGTSTDQFGWQTAISGNLIVVGAAGRNSNRGQVSLFDCTNPTACFQSSSLVASDGSSGDYFGFSVALSGYWVLIGANGHYSAGEAYLFDCTISTACFQASILTAPDSAVGDKFGSAVAISGNLLVISSPAKSSNKGVVHLFYCSISTYCTLISTIFAAGGLAGDQFGYSLSIFQSLIAVGAPTQNLGMGTAYLFSCSIGSGCLQVAQLQASDGVLGDNFGTSTSISSNKIAVGAPNQNLGRGKEYLFQGLKQI